MFKTQKLLKSVRSFNAFKFVILAVEETGKEPALKSIVPLDKIMLESEFGISKERLSCSRFIRELG